MDIKKKLSIFLTTVSLFTAGVTAKAQSDDMTGCEASPITVNELLATNIDTDSNSLASIGSNQYFNLFLSNLQNISSLTASQKLNLHTLVNNIENNFLSKMVKIDHKFSQLLPWWNSNFKKDHLPFSLVIEIGSDMSNRFGVSMGAISRTCYPNRSPINTDKTITIGSNYPLNDTSLDVTDSLIHEYGHILAHSLSYKGTDTILSEAIADTISQIAFDFNGRFAFGQGPIEAQGFSNILNNPDSSEIDIRWAQFSMQSVNESMRDFTIPRSFHEIYMVPLNHQAAKVIGHLIHEFSKVFSHDLITQSFMETLRSQGLNYHEGNVLVFIDSFLSRLLALSPELRSASMKILDRLGWSQRHTLNAPLIDHISRESDVSYLVHLNGRELFADQFFEMPFDIIFYTVNVNSTPVANHIAHNNASDAFTLNKENGCYDERSGYPCFCSNDAFSLTVEAIFADSTSNVHSIRPVEVELPSEVNTGCWSIRPQF